MNKYLFILLPCLLVLVGASCSVSFGDDDVAMRKNDATKKTVQEQQMKETKGERVSAEKMEAEPAPKPEVKPVKAEILVGDDAVLLEAEQEKKVVEAPALSAPCTTITCLVKKAQICEAEEGVFTYALGGDISGTARSYFKLQKNSSGECRISYQPKQVTLTPTDAQLQEAMDSGLTKEQIKEELELFEKAFNDPAVLSYMTICTGKPADVATYIGNIQAGRGSTSCQITVSGNQGVTTCTMEPGLTCQVVQN